MNIIETQNLTKTYGDFTAVSHLNLHIRKGSVYGFLGPNGAGKSTTMKICLLYTSYADYDIWNNDDCFLCALQYCRQHFGIPPCAENL